MIGWRSTGVCADARSVIGEGENLRCGVHTGPIRGECTSTEILEVESETVPTRSLGLLLSQGEYARSNERSRYWCWENPHHSRRTGPCWMPVTADRSRRSRCDIHFAVDGPPDSAVQRESSRIPNQIRRGRKWTRLEAACARSGCVCGFGCPLERCRVAVGSPRFRGKTDLGRGTGCRFQRSGRAFPGNQPASPG
jgi:hypothetical protein